MTALGKIVKSERMHGMFGTASSVRALAGREVEYEVTASAVNGAKITTWIPASQVTVIDLDEVLTHYETQRREMQERIAKLRDMVGKKVPKFNPEKHLDGMASHLLDAFRHEDGSLTYVVPDVNAGDCESPRTYDGNVATLIQTNTHCIPVDEDVAGLHEAYERFTHAEMRRYLSIFRPDILHFDEHWSAGDSSGWGYVTAQAWGAAMGKDYAGPITPQEAFDQEVSVYGEWANGNIYESCHVTKRGGQPDFVGGHLGYPDSEAIAAYHTDSPILEVLA